MIVELAGNRLEMRPDRSLWWPARRTALVADVHLGKDQVFRRAGVAIPGAVLDAELAALDAVLEATGAERLVVLGDWVHAAPAADDAWPHAIARWRARHASLDLVLVAGNHDRGLAPWLDPWRMTSWADGRCLDGLELLHEVRTEAPPPGLSGHVHPVVRLGRRGDRLRLPAFARKNEHLILPAFGRFTGGGEGLEREGWTFFPVSPDRVFALGDDPRARADRDPGAG
ncbi:ligase-associated DNA damage response endonuclease PdeM [Halomonas denitrificans]|nr:ligase-associated DNA damage response endonuclease PdeM [Halomonas denitrificans]